MDRADEDSSNLFWQLQQGITLHSLSLDYPKLRVSTYDARRHPGRLVQCLACHTALSRFGI